MSLEVIDSPRNQHVRFFRSLQRPKGRREHGAFLAEGARLIGEALQAHWPIKAAAVCEELLGGAAAELAPRLSQGPWPCWHMSERAFGALSAEETPQGVAIAAEARLVPLSSLSPQTSELTVGVWELRDPGNLGTVVRTAEFFGCRAMVAIGDCVDFFDPKTVRATAGAVFHLPLALAAPDEVLAWAREHDVVVVAATASGGEPPEQVSVQRPALLLIGSEAHGLPSEVEAAADLRVTLPRRGKVESLNAAVAGAICLSYLAR